MEFGVFDHVDTNGLPLHEYYDERLKFVEKLDRFGFRSYHVAEHHATPLGMAPSPSVYLAAVARCTSKLRLGPLVFALPLYHPIRLVQEICMLDQLSKGRLEIGFGRGASPIEAAYFGNDHADSERVYRETLDRVLKALTTEKLDSKDTYNEMGDVPLLVKTFQRPHPPLWYGVHSTASAIRAAIMGSHIVSLDTAEETRIFAESYRTTWKETHGTTKTSPFIGLGVFVHVDDNHERAQQTAQRAYVAWHNSFNWLFRKCNVALPKHQRPDSFDKMVEEGRAIAGTPDIVCAFLSERMHTATANYLVSQIAFGDMRGPEIERSVTLFGERVMPTLRNQKNTSW